MQMNNRFLLRDELPPSPTCMNCNHMIGNKGRQNRIVCVPHLKDIHATNVLVCELHSMKNVKVGISKRAFFGLTESWGR